MSICGNFKSKVSLFYSLKLLNSQLKNNKHCIKVGFFLNTLNRKLLVRNFSTAINLPRLHEQKEKTLLFFLDNLWDAEEILRSRYCLIMILSFKKHLSNTVHSSPVKARMDLNLVRKYIKLILAYLKNALVNDIDRINSKFLIFFYFLTKTTGLLTKSNFVSTRKLVLRNLFFIFVLSRGRARYFSNLTVTNNVISKSYTSFLPRLKYASSAFPTGLFLVLYSPYKSSFNLGSSNRLFSRHKQFLQKLLYVHRLLNISKLKRKGAIEQNISFAFREIFSKTGLNFSVLKKNFFLFESSILYSKINKKLKLQKLKNLGFPSSFKFKFTSANFPLIKAAKNCSSSRSAFSKFRICTKLFIRQSFTRIFFLPFGVKFIRRLFIGLISKLNFSATKLALKIRIRFRNRVPRGYFAKLLKIFTRRRAALRQLYKFFAYAFLKINRKVLNSINKTLVLSNSFLNFKRFVKNASSFANFYRPQFYLFRKLRHSFLRRSNQFRVNSNNASKKKRFVLISNYFKHVLNSTKIIVLKKRTVKQLNSTFSFSFSFFFFKNSSKNIPFFSNALFRELKMLAFSKFFNFRKFFDIFFFYLNLLKFIKISAKFSDVRNLLVYFPFFLHYGSQFISNTTFMFELLNNKKPIILLDKIILNYKNLFNNFLKFRLFKLEQLHLAKIEKFSKFRLKKKQLSKFKYIKRTPVQIFILERQNLRNLEFLTGYVKKLVVKFKYLARRKNDVSFSFKLKRRAMLAKKRADRLLAIKSNRAKKKYILKKTTDSSLFKYFATKEFKKQYAMYVKAREKFVKKWKRNDARFKIFRTSLSEGDFSSANYIHRFHFRKRVSKIDYRRLKRKFFVNLLFFMRNLKQKRIAYNYYKIGKKSFKLSALQKTSNPFFLRLKLKRYLFSDNYKKIINRFSFLNSSYGLKNCISKFCNFNFLTLNSINFFDSYLDKYKIVKFSFLKVYSSFFYSIAFYFTNDLVYYWLKDLKNSYLTYIFRLSKFKFSICLNDYSSLLKFLFYKSGYFFFSNKLLILFADLKNLTAFICKIKNSACFFFLIFLRAFFSQKFFPKFCLGFKYVTTKRSYSTFGLLGSKKNGFSYSYSNRFAKNRFFKFRFHFITFFKFSFFAKELCHSNLDVSTIRYDFVNFSKIYTLPCFNPKKIAFSCLNYCFQFSFLRSKMDFFPDIFLFSRNLRKDHLKHFKAMETASFNNTLFLGVGFFSFLYSTLRISKYQSFNKFFATLADIKKPKIFIQSPYYRRKKVVNKYQKFLIGLTHRSKRPMSLQRKFKKKFRRIKLSNFAYQRLSINSPWHRLFKKYLSVRVKRKILRKRERLLRKSKFFSKKANFKIYKKAIYKKPVFNRKFGLMRKQKKDFYLKPRSIKFLSYTVLSPFFEKEKRTYGLTTLPYRMKFNARFSKDKKNKAVAHKLASKSVSLVDQLLMPNILEGNLANKKLKQVFGNLKMYPSKRFFFLKKYFFDSTLKFKKKRSLNSKIFIPKLFNADLKFFNNFYNFSLSKINFFLINLKTQRFIRLLLIVSNQLQFNSKYLVKTETIASNEIVCLDGLDGFFENLFISDFFELSCLDLNFVAESSFDLVTLTLLDNFIYVFHTFFFRNNNSFLLHYFYNFCLLNFNYVVFLSDNFKDLMNGDTIFFELINTLCLFVQEWGLANVIRKKYVQFVTIKKKFKSFLFRSFSGISSTIRLFLYLINYSKLQGQISTVIPIKNFYHNFTRSFLKYLIRLNFVNLKIKIIKRSRRSKPKLRRYLVFKTEFFFFLHSLFTLFLEKFFIICEKSSMKFLNDFLSFVVNLFFKNLYSLSSSSKIFKLIIDRLFSRTSLLKLHRFNFKLKLHFLKVLLLNNKKFVSLFKNTSFKQIFFAPLNIKGSKLKLKVIFSENLRTLYSKHNWRAVKIQSKFESRKRNLPNNFKLNFLSSSRRFGMSFFTSRNLIEKIRLLSIKKFRRWNKYIKSKFFAKWYSGRRSKRFLGRHFRRKLKKYFFSELYCQFFEKQDMYYSQLSRLLLLRKAANLKLFYRYKIMAKTPKKRSFSFILKNELEPNYTRFLSVFSPKRGLRSRRRRTVIKKKFHSFLKRKIIVGFFLSPRFLNFKNFSNSSFFMKINFHKKIKNKLSLFLRLNRFMEFIFKIILRVKLYLKKKVFLLPNSLKSNLVITHFFSNNFYFYIVKVYRKLKLLTISFFNKLSIYFNKVRGFDDRLTRKFNFRLGSLKFLFFYNFLSSKFLRMFVLRYFFFGYYIKYRFQFMNRFLWFRALPLNSFLLTPKVFIIITRVKNNFFITGVDLYGRLLYKTSPGIVNFTGSDRVSKYAWFEASVDFFDGFLEFFRYFLRSRKRKKISYTLLRISREININFNKKKKKYGAFLHPLNYIFAAKRKKRKKAKKRRLKSKIILRRFFVISKGVSNFHLRIFVKGMLNERFYVLKYFAGAVNYPMRSFSLCRTKKVRRV